jgi:hypothetical protein
MKNHRNIPEEAQKQKAEIRDPAQPALGCAYGLQNGWIYFNGRFQSDLVPARPNRGGRCSLISSSRFHGEAKR